MVASAASCVGGQGPQPVAGLRGDDDCGAAGGDDLAELLEHQGRAVEVDAQDQLRRCLGRRDSGGMDDAGDLTQAAGVLDQR